MVDFNLFRLAFEDVEAVYPTKFYKMRFLNAGLFVNLLVSMVRRFTPNEIHNKIELVNQSDNRMDQICLVPTAQAATERVLSEMSLALKRRYENERNFRL